MIRRWVVSLFWYFFKWRFLLCLRLFLKLSLGRSGASSWRLRASSRRVRPSLRRLKSSSRGSRRIRAMTNSSAWRSRRVSWGPWASAWRSRTSWRRPWSPLKGTIPWWSYSCHATVGFIGGWRCAISLRNEKKTKLQIKCTCENKTVDQRLNKL